MTIDAGILTSTTLTEVLVVTLVADQSADSVILTKIPTGRLVPLNQRLHRANQQLNQVLQQPVAII